MYISGLFNNVARLRERAYGRRAFILGNGPSITKEDLTLLKEELVIGMNASTILEKEHGFISHYYVLSDSRFLNHPEKRCLATKDLHKDTVRVLRAELREIDDETVARQTYYVRALKRDGFSHDLALGFYYGCTTTMLAIQLANYLGCKEIYLLGVDLRYSPESPRFYAEPNPQLEDSFTSVQLWNVVNASAQVRRDGGTLINCSSASMLRPYLPYMDFKAIFQEKE